MSVEQVTILGSTGSVGRNTLDVIAQHSDRYQVFALTGNRQVDDMFMQVKRFHPQVVVMRDSASAEQLQTRLRQHRLTNTQILDGENGLITAASHASVDTVMAAIMGAAGLTPTLAAVRAGKKVLLANKEPLVMAGSIFIRAAKASGAQLLPIDSEHSAIFQCMPCGWRFGRDDAPSTSVRKIFLTASGGPFRTLPIEQLATVTPMQACAHPTWRMGRKISVDSATMMNKGLELIEACWLFGCSPEQIEVVVHPQSVVHSMVEYVDGSVLAQLSHPDMRIPIAYGLAWPKRIQSGVSSFDVVAAAPMDFEKPDWERFPCLGLAVEAVKRGGTIIATLNAANEIAVQAFLDQHIRFTDIAVVVERAMSHTTACVADTLTAIEQADRQARASAAEIINTI